MENNFSENGYIIIRNLIKDKECFLLNNWIYNNNDNLTNQNLFGNNSPYNNIINNSKILDICKNLLKNDCKFNMIKVNNKKKFHGKDIEYHQEFKYQSILHKNNHPDNYIQIFIALNKHNNDNGCLKIIPKSHKYGLLKTEDFLDINCKHKYKIIDTELLNILKDQEIVNCYLNSGDALLFHSLLVHGSSSNKSKVDRKAIVGHIISKNLIFDEEETKKNYKNRKNYEKNEINKLLKYDYSNNKHVHKLI